MKSVVAALTQQVKKLPPKLCQSLTWDWVWNSQLQNFHNGDRYPSLLCDPRSPWQRSANENTNRLFGSTSRKTTTYQFVLRRIRTRSPKGSISAQGKRSTLKHQQINSIECFNERLNLQANNRKIQLNALHEPYGGFTDSTIGRFLSVSLEKCQNCIFEVEKSPRFACGRAL